MWGTDAQGQQKRRSQGLCKGPEEAVGWEHPTAEAAVRDEGRRWKDMAPLMKWSCSVRWDHSENTRKAVKRRLGHSSCRLSPGPKLMPRPKGQAWEPGPLGPEFPSELGQSLGPLGGEARAAGRQAVPPKPVLLLSGHHLLQAWQTWLLPGCSEREER